MGIRKILMVAGGGSGDEVAAVTAIRAARPFGASLSFQFVRPRPEDAIAFVGEGMSSAVITEVVEGSRREIDTRAANARSACEAACRAEGLTLGGADGPAWVELEGVTDMLVAQLGRVADLVVVPHPTGDGLDRAEAVIEAALFDTGKPLLIAGSEAPREFSGTMLVGWNGSAQAAAAVSAALPFLTHAAAVEVVWIGGPDAVHPSAEELCGYLALHGVKARDVRLDSAGDQGEQLQEYAATKGASLLVTGAYGHSRFREMVFGGVTRSILDKAGPPVLMAR